VPDIAARRVRAAKTDLVPGRRVRVINADCGPQHQARKKRLCRQTLPGVAADVIVLDRPQHRILLIGRQFAKAPAPPSAGFLVNGFDAVPPCLLHRQHPFIAIAVAPVLVQLFVNERDDWNRPIGAVGLRDQPIADSRQYLPLGLRQETAIRYFTQSLLDDGPRLVVPRGRIPLFENVVSREAVVEHLAH